MSGWPRVPRRALSTLALVSGLGVLATTGCTPRRTASTGGETLVKIKEADLKKGTDDFLEDLFAKYRLPGFSQEVDDNDLLVSFSAAGNEAPGEVLQRAISFLCLAGTAVQGLDDVHILVREGAGRTVRVSSRLSDIRALLRREIPGTTFVDRLDTGYEPAFPVPGSPDTGAVERALARWRLTGLDVASRNRNVLVAWEIAWADPARLFADLTALALEAAPAAGAAEELVLVPKVAGQQVIVCRVRVRDASAYLDGTLPAARFHDRIALALY